MLKSFERTQIRSMSLENRYVYSATWDLVLPYFRCLPKKELSLSMGM